MYRGLPREYRKRLPEFLRKRTHWIVLVLYDNTITAFVLGREDHSNEMSIISIKHDTSKGIKEGRIVNSRKAGAVVDYLLRSVSEEAEIRDNRVLIGLDIPPLRLTPKQWTDDSCLKSACNETTYRRILHNIVRESSFDSQHIIEILPLKIWMDERLVEDPCGITGQMSMDNMLISLSYQDYKDFEECLGNIGHRCEAFFSGYSNLCSAFSESAAENEHALLIDTKYNSTDVIMFQGDQPVAMKCYKQGLDRIVVESISSMLNVSRNDAITYLDRYCRHSEDKDTEIVGKDELPAFSAGLKWWEIHEIMMGQLRNFIFMQDGINDLVTRFQRDLRATPQRLIVTGEGSRIPEINELFENKLKVKCEPMNDTYQLFGRDIPATAYGMAQSIASDLGAKIRVPH